VPAILKGWVNSATGFAYSKRYLDTGGLKGKRTMRSRVHYWRSVRYLCHNPVVMVTIDAMLWPDGDTRFVGFVFYLHFGGLLCCQRSQRDSSGIADDYHVADFLP